eukprot:Nk52_evm57s78 gene=Nk52_evmTU57s78
MFNRNSKLVLLAVFTVLLLAVCQEVISGRDFYAILGVDKGASTQQIRRAYRKLAKEHHPDANKGDESSQEKFKEIAAAYEVLSDEEKRQIYDQHGEEGLNNNNRGGGGDMFDGFFNFGNRRGEQKGHNIGAQLSVTLEDLFNGNVFSVEVDKQILCPHCRGSGAKDADHVHKCNECGGQGVKIMRQQVAPGFFQQYQTTCPKCGGKGKIITAKCPHCQGKKVKRGRNVLDISVERGMADGENIVFPKQSDQSPDAPPGDLVFVVRTQPHPVFERRGMNLYMKMTITLAEALLGFEKKIKHLDNSYVSISRREVTQPGYVLTLPEEGMPKHNFPSERGDLFIEFQVILPTSLEHLNTATSSLPKEEVAKKKKDLLEILYDAEYEKNTQLKTVLDKVLRITSDESFAARAVHVDEDEEDEGLYHDEL